MWYKCTFEVLECDKLYNKLVRCAGLGINYVGRRRRFEYTTSTEPTMEYISNFVHHLESYKDDKIMFRNAAFVGFLPIADQEKEEFTKKMEGAAWKGIPGDFETDYD